jgi:nucleotide-binding universal stress UspA family protein
MTVTTRLLCAIDAAYPSRLAVEAAVEMAQLLSVPMAFLTIKPTSQEGGSKTHFWDDRILAAVDAQLSTVLGDAAAIARRSGLSDFDCVVTSGTNIATAIVNYAQEKGFDHIVLGSSRPSAPFGATPGSVAAEVVRTAKCPVTVVR